jgi:hypothetical protein
MLGPGGRLFVLEATQRFIPTREAGWVDDNADAWDMLRGYFELLRAEPANAAIVPVPPTFWGVF